MSISINSGKEKTTDFSRVVVQFLPKSKLRAKQQRFLDTTDFSRVVIQFVPKEQNSGDSSIPPTLVAW
jgi:hypothetical protein